ncbi:MAG: hypothetical protein WC269_01870 [Candidatus Gracilibacteria bacterium]
MSVKCEDFPCKIKQKTGLKILLIKKDGYEPAEKFATVKRGKETVVSVNLIRIAGLKEIKEFPQTVPKYEYKLVEDETIKNQKLVEVGDKYERAIVFFPNGIKNPKIFVDKNMLLVVDDENGFTVGYSVNVYSKERKVIGGDNMENITDAKVSPDGKWVVYSIKGSDLLWMANEKGEYRQLSVTAKVSQTVWTNENTLIFSTTRKEVLSGAKDEIGRDKVTFKEFSIAKNYLFGFYNPEMDYYSKIGRFPLDEAPDNMMVLGSGSEFYFSSGGKKYSVGL